MQGRDLLELFEERTERTDGCWLWRGPLASGYGRVTARKINGKKRPILAHRFAYEHFVGPIPEGTEIDHLCRNTLCVNPAHLEAVTHAENIARSATNPCAINARKTHCKRGHPLSGDNLYVDPLGKRNCRTCTRRRDARNRAKNRAKRNAYFRERRRLQSSSASS